MKTFVCYEVSQNQDQTEGRGPMVPVSWWVNENDAVKDAKGRGTMGVGDGEVHALYLEGGLKDLHGTRRNLVREKIYGYRKDWNDRFSSGYMDLREAPTQDPDYKEYMRLKAKFGG